MSNKTVSVALATLLVAVPLAYRTSHAQELNQQVPPSWGLDRIDQRSQALDDKYQYLYDGSGVDIYILDSGINTSHTDFTGRIQPGISFISDTPEDCNGHGTHVSGIAAGSTYGVAKRANIIPVKVLNCNNAGSFMDVVNAINWVIDQHDSSEVAVMNLSFITAYNESLNALVRRAYEDNIVVVAGAGNNNADASSYSPASESTALTVAGATIGTSSGNGIFPASNYGSPVDLYAPSSYIQSAWIGSSTASNSKSGTSQAAPFVAGVAAIAVQQYPNMSAADIVNLIINSATANAMQSVPANTVNKMVYSLLTNEIQLAVTTTTSTTSTTSTTTTTTTIPPTTTTTTLIQTTTTTIPQTTTTTTVPETTTTVAETTTTISQTTTTTTVVETTTTVAPTTTVPQTATTVAPTTTTTVVQTTTTTLPTITTTLTPSTTTTVSAPSSSSSSSGGSSGGGGDSGGGSSSSVETKQVSVPSQTTVASSTTTLKPAETTTTTTVAPVVTVAPVKFTYTFICIKFNNNIKGRQMIKVTSVNLMCPKGYRVNQKLTSAINK